MCLSGVALTAAEAAIHSIPIVFFTSCLVNANRHSFSRTPGLLTKNIRPNTNILFGLLFGQNRIQTEYSV